MLTFVMSLTSSSITYSLLCLKRLNYNRPLDLRVRQSINSATTHEVVANQHANLWYSKRKTTYLGTNSLSKLKAQEMAGSLTGHYTSFLSQTNWTTCEQIAEQLWDMLCTFLQGGTRCADRLMSQDLSVTKYWGFRRASDTRHCCMLTIKTIQFSNRYL
jgi:hypothetical protein